MKSRLEACCPKCGEETLDLEAQSAAHDRDLLDLVIECSTDDGGCGVILNGFMTISDMMEVQS